jgi:hypothetical protein
LKADVAKWFLRFKLVEQAIAANGDGALVKLPVSPLQNGTRRKSELMCVYARWVKGGTRKNVPLALSGQNERIKRVSEPCPWLPARLYI